MTMMCRDGDDDNVTTVRNEDHFLLSKTSDFRLLGTGLLGDDAAAAAFCQASFKLPVETLKVLEASSSTPR